MSKVIFELKIETLEDEFLTEILGYYCSVEELEELMHKQPAKEPDARVVVRCYEPHPQIMEQIKAYATKEQIAKALEYERMLEEKYKD